MSSGMRSAIVSIAVMVSSMTPSSNSRHDIAFDAAQSLRSLLGSRLSEKALGPSEIARMQRQVSPTDPPPFRVGRSHTGLGLFATMPIKKNTLIVEYSGPRIPTSEAHARERKGRSKYMFEISPRWSIDGGGRDDIGRYANHACRPNAESVVVRG